MEYPYLIGVDEVGRGPVAGPVYVCALFISSENSRKIIEENNKLPLRDSKKLTEKMRNSWFEKIKSYADSGMIKYVISKASSKEIDEKGIATCIKACVNNSVEKLNPGKDTKVFLDGGLFTKDNFIQETVIKGDENIPVISLASIVAKVSRDEEMKKIAKEYPEFLLEKNKGYGTKDHLDAIKKYGLTNIHRKSFLKSYI